MSSNTGLGELSDGSLPSISTTSNSTGSHSHTRGTMEISGSFTGLPRGFSSWDGVFYNTGTQGNVIGYANTAVGLMTTGFQASKNWTGSTNSTGAHTHSITVNSGAYTRSDSKIYSRYIKCRNIIKYEYKKFL